MQAAVLDFPLFLIYLTYFLSLRLKIYVFLKIRKIDFSHYTSIGITVSLFFQIEKENEKTHAYFCSPSKDSSSDILMKFL